MKNKRSSPTNLFVKECLVNALLQISREKALSAITISELCRKAGVSRMTFYRNYSSIEDVFIHQLSDIFTEYQDETDTLLKSGTYCDQEHIGHYFDYIYRYRSFFAGLVRCGLDVVFLSMLTSYICDNWKEECSKYILTAFAGSLYNMFRLWSEDQYAEDKSLLVDKLVAIYFPTRSE